MHVLRAILTLSSSKTYRQKYVYASVIASETEILVDLTDGRLLMRCKLFYALIRGLSTLRIQTTHLPYYYLCKAVR